MNRSSTPRCAPAWICRSPARAACARPAGRSWSRATRIWKSIIRWSLGKPAPASSSPARRGRCRTRSWSTTIISNGFTVVIPGCASWRRPESITPDRGYGFRARSLCSRPGMTAELKLRRRRVAENRLDGKPEAEQLHIATDRTVDFEADRKPAGGHAGKQREPWNSGIAARIGIADHGIEHRHGRAAVDRHLARALDRIDRRRRRDGGRKQDGIDLVVAEIVVIHLLQRRALYGDRILIRSAKRVGRNRAECALDVGARDLRRY